MGTFAATPPAAGKLEALVGEADLAAFLDAHGRKIVVHREGDDTELTPDEVLDLWRRDRGSIAYRLR